MALEIEKQFSVKAPKSEVWQFLTDLYRVAACLPGSGDYRAGGRADLYRHDDRQGGSRSDPL